MAINFKFNCSVNPKEFLEVRQENKYVIVKGLSGDNGYEQTFQFVLDITTAIKFAKTIRTEINRAKEVEHGI
tara:strand:- start:391 stop:606 length:216 start_codon:yes stop_codon:yes gene_type:complete